MGYLTGKVSFITGAGSGIAQAAAARFAQEGAKVVIAEINPELGRNTEKKVQDQGGDALFVQTDVTDHTSVQNAITQAQQHYGQLNVLFNCAGGSVAADAPVTEVDLSVWDHTIDLDLKGPFLCCRYGIPALIEAGGGTIVNVASAAALQGNFPAHVYSTAKGGILSFTRALAGAYSKHNIRANAICPGVILTDRVKKRFGLNNPTQDQPGSDADSEKMPSADNMGMQRYPFGVGMPKNIAAIALFLASEESRMINGATIPADGGLSAY